MAFGGAKYRFQDYGAVLCRDVIRIEHVENPRALFQCARMGFVVAAIGMPKLQTAAVVIFQYARNQARGWCR
jgi:hypothetical protein